MFRKTFAFVLILTILLSSVFTVSAAEITDLSEEVLRVSDEFKAQYPAGAFSLPSVRMDMQEYNGRQVINVIRQGGTAGSVEVTVKAVDISAKIGQDYRLSIPGLIWNKRINADGDSATLLESGNIGMLPEAADDTGVVTVVDSVYESDKNDSGGESGSNDENGSNGGNGKGVNGESDSSSDSSGSTVTDSVYGDKGGSLIPGTTETVEIGSTGLRGIRQQATGKDSDREKLGAPDEEEMQQLNAAASTVEEFYDEAPGTAFTLSFADGERTRELNLDIVNDKIPEAEEQIVFVITGVSGEGAIGLQREMTVNIIDDEAYETPAMGFGSAVFTVEDGTATVTVDRTSGVNYFAGARIYTVGDSARAGEDYTEVDQKILFAPGQTQLSLDIPVTENESEMDRYFYIRLEPDKGCAVSGNETAQVLLNGKEKAAEAMPLRSGALAVLSAAEGAGTNEKIIVGTAQEVLDNRDIQYLYNSNVKHRNMPLTEYYEVVLEKNNQIGRIKIGGDYYMSQLESVVADLGLYAQKVDNHFDVWIKGYLVSKKRFTSTLYRVYDHSYKGLAIWGRIIRGRHTVKLFEQGQDKYSDPVNIELSVSNGKGDYGSMEIYSVTVNYRYFDLNTVPAKDTFENIYDLSKMEDDPAHTEESSPGEIVLETADGRQVKGMYSSQNHTFNVKTKNVKEGYYLKELRFYKNDDYGANDYYTYKMAGGPQTLIIDDKWLYDHAAAYGKDGKFRIQPHFERFDAALTISLKDEDKNKGEILGSVNAGNPKKVYTNDNPKQKFKLYVGDKVKLTGMGYGQNTVAGYYVTIGDGMTTDVAGEVGQQDAGIYVASLKKDVKISPIFGERKLSIRRDPSNLAQYPNLQGQLTCGGSIFSQQGSVDDINSGQVIDFLSIPPPGYTTMWANRSGDTDGDGKLADEEVNDPNTNRPYRRYDYNGDGILDAEYGDAIYGDLFNYKVNQPDPLFYYFYAPLNGQTLYTGEVSGRVLTREYDIRRGFTKVNDYNGENCDKLVPVEGALMSMGGSYDPSNPDAQMGYGTTTDNTGKFVFDVTNVLKSQNYILGINYGNMSFIDKINTTASKQVILPTFTSMKPISINAHPKKGEDPKVVAGSVVMLEDEVADFVLETASLENNVTVSKAFFRIYSHNGTLLSDIDAPPLDVHADKVIFTANLKDTFTSNGVFTVQLVDQNGNSSREYNTGFEFRPPIKPTVMLPSYIADKNPSIPIVGSVMGALDIGLAECTDIDVSDEGYTLYLGIGKQFKEKTKELVNTIDKAVKEEKAKNEGSKDEDSEGDAEEIEDKMKEDNKNEKGPEPKSNVKVKSTIANNLNITLSLEMSIGCDKKAPPEAKSPYYFRHLKFMVTMEDTITSKTTIVLPIGLAVTLKMDVGGAVTGFIHIEPITAYTGKPLKVYADEYGNYPYTGKDFRSEGGIILEPRMKLTVSGQYAVAEVSVSGEALFRLVFTTDHHDSGMVTLHASVNVTSLGFEVYSKSFGSWKTTLFGNTKSLMSTMLAEGDINTKEFEPIARDYLESRSGWLGDEPYLQDGTPNETGFTERTLMSGTYPHPDPQLMRIDEDSLLLVFVEDDADRPDENRGAIHYSISHDNGMTFSQPELLADDSTLDSYPRLTDLGDKILCMYSSLDRLILDDMTMEEILEANGLEMAFFDKTTFEFDRPVDVTKYTARVNPANESQLLGDYYSDESGVSVCDAIYGRALMIYTKSDYTSDADRNFKAEDLFGSYSAIAYMLYDTKTSSFLPYTNSDYPAGLTDAEKEQWDADWYGQRFLDTEITDEDLPDGILSDPLVFDLTAAMEDETAYIAYTVDYDGDMETHEDRDIYLQTYSFSQDDFQEPIKVSDTQPDKTAKPDGKPMLILYGGEVYLFYHADTGILYYNIDDLLSETSGDGEQQSPAVPYVALEASDENLPGDDYRVLVGDDGKLYLVWTEETVRLADGVEPGSQDALKPKNVYHEDQIYASVLYEDFGYRPDDMLEASVNTNSPYGRWSSKVQITEGPGSYSDISAGVMADGSMVITAKKSEKVIPEGSEVLTRVDDQNTIQLVTLSLTPIAHPEMSKDAIVIEPAYPMPGETVGIYAEFSNSGLMPFHSPAVDFYAVQGGQETLIGSVDSADAVYGGTRGALGMEWIAPENMQDLKILARLRNSEDGTIAAQAEKAFPYGTDLAFGLFDVEHVARNYFRTYAEVYHTGNRPLTGAELVINRIDAERSVHELKRISLDDSLVAKESFIIDEPFEMFNRELTEGEAEIEVRIEKDGELLVKDTAAARKDVATLYGDLLSRVSSVNMTATSLRLHSGEKVGLNAAIYPAEAAESNRLVYQSSNPAVADVSSEGEVTAIRSGTATITAYAVPEADVKSMTLDGHSVKGDLLDNLALEDCMNSAVQVEVYSTPSEGSSGSGNTVQQGTGITVTGSTVTLKATVSAGKAVAAVPAAQISKAIDSALKELAQQEQPEARGIEINLEASADAETIETGVPTAALKEIVDRGMNSLTLTSPVAKMTFDRNALAGIVSQAEKDVKITASRVDASDLSEEARQVVGARPVFDFSVTSGDRTISEFDGNVAVSVPYSPSAEEDYNAIVIYYINDDGELEIIRNGVYHPETGMVTFETRHFSQYAVGYNRVEFKDVQEAAWYKNAVAFIAARGITTGTGNGNYSPEAKLTRGEFIVLLMRTYGIAADENPTDNFADAGNTYYTGYLAAAKRLGISMGVGNNLFAPDNRITRQEAFTLVYHALKSMEQLPDSASGKTLSQFSDNSKIASWAKDAMTLLVKTGIVNGSNGRLDPTGTTTRAEMAQVLYNLLRKTGDGSCAK